MTAIFESLAHITTGYSVFEKDQVLTHEQLNSLVGYTDDQVRLTRVKLLGVGLVTGMRPRQLANSVRISAGVGVTTDGDLLYLDGETTYTHFRAFDPARPRYAPLYIGGPENGTLRKVYELLPSADAAVGARPLSEFPGGAAALGQLVVVAYMESYVKDDDLCTGNDCDNLGRDVVNHQLMLMLPPGELADLEASIPTPDDAYDTLPQLSVGRPQLSSGWTLTNQLVSAYRSVCQTANDALQDALEQLSGLDAALGDILDHAQVSAWRTRLTALASHWAANSIGIQYYYDLLKDLVDTWNGFCETLFDDRAWLHAPPSRFAKHLLLGTIDAGDPDAHRTAFYPAPLLRLSPDTRDHAATLLRKLGAMLQHFQVVTHANQAIRITPSAGEAQPLEQRAIPVYYPHADIVRDWSQAHRRRRSSSRIRSYHAGLWSGDTDPLAGQIAAFDFFRIEGHIGRPVGDAVAEIEAEIRARNLPFAVEAVFLNSNRIGLLRRRPPRYTDLHRLHYVLRQDVSHQLFEVQQFGATFKDKVVLAGNAGHLPQTLPEAPSYHEIATVDQNALEGRVAAAREVLDRPYSSYKAAPQWKDEINATMQKAGEIKNKFGALIKTEFTTPIDNLLANQHGKWLEWLDEIIDKKQDDDDDKLLFGKFLDQHPGLDHLAGVMRGGTFVLVYDAQQRVVADFALAHYCCVEQEDEPVEQPKPTIPTKPIKPPWIITDGIRFVPPPEKLITDKLVNFKQQLDVELKPKLEVQEQYFKFQETYTKAFDDLVNKTITKNLGTTEMLERSLPGGDELLSSYMEAADLQNKMVEQLRAANAPDEQIAKAEAAAADAVAEAVKRIGTADSSFSLGLRETQVLGKLPPSQRNEILGEVAKKGMPRG